jgi:hypothetical protein
MQLEYDAWQWCLDAWYGAVVLKHHVMVLG